MRILIVIALLTTLGLNAQGQGIVEVRTANESMSQGSHDALKVFIPEADNKDVEKLWKREVKGYDGKVSSSKGEIIADDAEMGQVSANTIDIYARASAGKHGAILTVWFDLGGAYLNSGHDGFENARKLLYKFGVDAAKDAVEQQIKEEERVLKDLNNETDKLIKQKEGLDKDIERWLADIEQAKKDLEKNLADQETNKSAVENQNKELERVMEKMKNIK